jgi:hypothetical protein
MEVKDLSTLGQDKRKQILNLKLPISSDRPLTIKEFDEYSIHNFDQVGKILVGILDFMRGQHNVNEVYKRELDTINKVLDAWIKEAKKLGENSNDKKI